MSDLALCQDVLDELEFEPRVDASRIGVHVEDGAVTLSGQVRSYAEKLVAISVASSVKGVDTVGDEIDIRPKETQRSSDPEIKRRIHSVIDWMAAVPGGDVEVTVSEGHVTLRGVVEWRFQAETVELLVGQLCGITGLTNALEVGRRASAPEILNRIRKAFHRDAEVYAAAIEIVAADGRVMLKGSVRNLAESRAAERAAWAAPGVTEVINCLDVG